MGMGRVLAVSQHCTEQVFDLTTLDARCGVTEHHRGEVSETQWSEHPDRNVARSPSAVVAMSR